MLSPRAINPHRRQPAALLQVDDPIIIKGGSVTLSFEQIGFRDVTTSAGDKLKRFEHVDPTRQLTQLVILRSNAATAHYDPLSIAGPIPDGRIALQPRDMIVTCYS